MTEKNEWPSETKMQTYKIEKVNEEFFGNKTFFINGEMEFEPGQFLMFWLPGIDEKPLAIIPNGKKFAVNIEAQGIATKEMLKLKIGDIIGVRGPYGRGFSFGGIKNAIIVAGGVGTAPIISLVKKLNEQGTKVKIILGGRTKERIMFEKILKKYGEVYITTDDGSYGEKGFYVQLLEKFLKKEKPGMVYACGPEIMMVNAFKIARENRVKFEASLERYMKCGIGLCGQCVCGGKFVCKDGPVFSGKELEKLDEFGKTAYTKSGKKVGLKEYYEWREK